MTKSKAKQQKLVKKPDNNANTTTTTKIDKKFKKKKKTLPKPPMKDVIQLTTTNESDSEPETDMVQNLLEPYTKDQLIDFLIDAALKDDSVFNRIRDVADKDVSHRKIFVYGLDWDTTKETLVSAFQQYGEIGDCNVVTDHNTGKSKGYGFVLFTNRQGAIKALKEPRKKINNRVASCQLASIGSVPPKTYQTTGRKIYVSNVHADVDPEKLKSFFAKFGEIEVGPIGFDMFTGKSRGYALFVYKTFEGAKKVLEEPFKMFEGHQLHCKRATEGKDKVVGGAASVTTTLQPVPQAVPAAQNLAMFSQNPGLNPFYGGFIGNPNTGLMVNPLMMAGGFGQVGQATGATGATPGLGWYGGVGLQGLGSLGGSASVLGAYGRSGADPSMQGLQHAYPSSQIGQTSSAGAQGASGSFSGYPSYMR